MKKIFILLFSIFSLTSFTACDEKDDIRKNIDELNARLDILANDLEGMNDNIRSLYNVVNGLTFITSYEMDAKGNYTLTLSNSKQLTVYSGQPDADVPVIGINDAGNWIATIMGEEKELTDDNGEPIPAVPVDGKNGRTPIITIGEDGYWYYQLIGEEPQRIEGRYNIANIDRIPASIFANGVKVDGNKITFSFSADSNVEVYLFGGLDLTFSEASVTVAQGKTIKLTATQTNVKGIVLDPTPLQVDLQEKEKENLSVTAPANLETGEHTVHFQIFSAENYRLVKELKVIVTE